MPIKHYLCSVIKTTMHVSIFLCSVMANKKAVCCITKYKLCLMGVLICLLLLRQGMSHVKANYWLEYAVYVAFYSTCESAGSIFLNCYLVVEFAKMTYNHSFSQPDSNLPNLTFR